MHTLSSIFECKDHIHSLSLVGLPKAYDLGYSDAAVITQIDESTPITFGCVTCTRTVGLQLFDPRSMSYEGLRLDLPMENISSTLCPALLEVGAGAMSEICRLFPSSDDRYWKDQVKLSLPEVKYIRLAKHAWEEKREFERLCHIASPLPGVIKRGDRTSHARILQMLEGECAAVGCIDHYIISCIRSREVECQQEQVVQLLMDRQLTRMSMHETSPAWDLQSLGSAMCEHS